MKTVVVALVVALAVPAVAAGNVESEGALTDRWCKSLEERSAAIEKRLANIDAEKDPRAALAACGAAYRDGADLVRTVQREFDEDYERMSRLADGQGVAGTPQVGYSTGTNRNSLQLSEAQLQAVAIGTRLMVERGLPFAQNDENGIPASAVTSRAESACRSPRRKALGAEIAASTSKLRRPFDVRGWQLEKDLPLSAGDVVSVKGGIVAEGSSLMVRMVTSNRGVVRNCQPTKRFSHFDVTGHARYYEQCEHVGAREVVILVKLKAIGWFLPPKTTLKPADYVELIARVSKVSKREAQQAGLKTTTHEVDVEPIVTQQLTRDGKALYTF